MELMTCSHCGAETPVDSRFCKECGQRLAPEEELTCPHCGTKIPAGSKFCKECGGEIAERVRKKTPRPRAGLREQIRKKGLLNWTLDSLGSIRLTIPLLTILTIAAAVGGIIPQAPNTPNAELLYRSYGRFWNNIIKILLLDDVFHSWWFIALLGLFSVNLLICMVRRLRRTIRFLTTPLRPLSERGAKNAAVASWGGKGRGEVRETARQVLRRRRFKFREEGDQLFGERWRFSRLAPDLIHLGILVILIGGLLGIFRFEGYISLNETELGKLFPPCSAEQQGDCIENADFGIRVDDFRAELYPQSMMYKDFWTTLTVIEDGQEVKSKQIEVNDPLAYKGITFYQTNYGDDLGGAQATIAVEERGSGAGLGDFQIRVGERFQIPGSEERVEFSRFFTSFQMGQGGPVNVSTPTPQNPAAILQIYQGDDPEPDYWDITFANFPETHLNQDKPYKFYLKDFFVPKLDGISYSRNPGYPVFWWGFVAMMAGLFGTFYLAPKRVWVLLDPQEERVLIKGGGHLSWGRRRALEGIAREMERKLKGG